MRKGVGVRARVCDAHSFSKSQSVCYHTSPLYSNVRTEAMFGCPPPAAFPPSRLNTKTIYSLSVPPTAPCSPICLLHALHRGPVVGEPATAHGNGVTSMVLDSHKNNVLLTRCMPTCICLQKKTPAAACPPLRDLNPRSMPRLSSAFPVCYYPMCLETCPQNHQHKSFWAVPMLHYISVHCHGGPAGVTQRRARCPCFRLKKCGVESHVFQVCSSLYAWLTGIIVSWLALAPPPPAPSNLTGSIGWGGGGGAATAHGDGVTGMVLAAYKTMAA